MTAVMLPEVCESAYADDVVHYCLDGVWPFRYDTGSYSTHDFRDRLDVLTNDRLETQAARSYGLER